MITIPHFHRLSELKNQAMSYLDDHSILITTVSLVTFCAIATGVRNHVFLKSTTAQQVALTEHTATPTPPSPTIENPTPTIYDVLGAASDTGSSDISYNDVWTMPTPFPTFPPIPIPTYFLDSPSTTTSTPSPSNSTGNPNCTTAAGVPNSWYSDVYPNPPVSTTTGSVTLIVDIRDCNKNKVSSDSLTISVSSGDSGTQVNGNNLPYTLAVQNGEISFSVMSQTTGTVTLIVQDTTSGFTVTNINNHNPSISFSASATPTPTSSATPAPTPTVTITPTDTPAATSSGTPVPSPT